jgi:NADH-quinone oxidoreductase subunit F
MDLHFTSARATQAERDAVDLVLGPPEDAWNAGHQARERRHLLLPVLHGIQERIGWIGGGALNYACERLCVPPAEAYGVATFYAMFSTTPRAPVVLHVCDDIACLCAGANDLCAALESAFGPAGTPSGDGRATWLRSPCLGLCDRAPAALLSVAGDAPLDLQYAPASVQGAKHAYASAALPPEYKPPSAQTGGVAMPLLRRAGVVNPESLDDYLAHDGYRALARAFDVGPDAVIAEISVSKLMGRGGAAFPTGRKIEAVARAAATPHYIVCNADESEPGTFKDRVLMECDPFAIVEAMTIAAFAARCDRGFIYVRGEYPLATRRLQGAIDAARHAGLLGADVMGRGFAFEVEIRRGAGAYICGEETALFNSIEGKRGEPRSKPPFPVEAGLFGKPTLVNNVETLANLLPIVLSGGEAFARTGTAESTGTRLFCLSGAVVRPGVYEVPHGTTVGELIKLGGGVVPGRRIQTILLGGAAGSFVGPEALSMQLSFEHARAAFATLGSGVVMVFDETADLMAILLRIARFFRDESCGQCVPCRVGTVRQEEALQRLAAAGPQRARDAALLEEIGRVMRDASICGLGQTAATAIASAQRFLGAKTTEGTA